MPASPRPVDVHVGARVRLRRTLLGMSQEKLGEAVGLTFQQIQKYERGTNRICASRLHQFAQVLDVPVAFFFDDMPIEIAKTNQVLGRPVVGLAEDQEPFDQEQLVKRETLELVRAYYRVSDPNIRKRLFELVKAVAGKIPGEKRGRPRKHPLPDSD